MIDANNIKRIHRRIDVLVKANKIKIEQWGKKRCGGCGKLFTKNSYAGSVWIYPEEMKGHRISVGQCKKCYYAKYE